VKHSPTDKPPTVLIVDGNTPTRDVLSGFLRDCGYTVLEATSIAVAQKMLQAQPGIGIVFIDVDEGGPDMGLKFVGWVRETIPRVRVLLAHGARGFTDQSLALCEEGLVLTKPYSTAALADHMKRLWATPRR